MSIAGGIISRTPSNSVSALAQMIIRIKPIMEKSFRKVQKGTALNILAIIQDIRAQIDDGLTDINGDALLREISPDPTRPFTVYDAYELLAYKVSNAINDTGIPNYLPYFYIHFSETDIVPFLSIRIEEPSKLQEVLLADLKRSGKKIKSFDSINATQQILFVKIDRHPSNPSVPIQLCESLDLREVGGEKYQLFTYFTAESPGKYTQVTEFFKDKKGWFSVFNQKITALPNHQLFRETRHSSTPVIFVGYIQGSSNFETYRPGYVEQKSSSVAPSSSAATGAIKARSVTFVENAPEPSEHYMRSLKQSLFDPAIMDFKELPDLEFSCTNDFNSRVKGLENNVAAKLGQNKVIFKTQNDTLFTADPQEGLPDNMEICADLTRCLPFVNEFIENKPIELNIISLTAPPQTVRVQFEGHQTIADLREYVNRALAPSFKYRPANRYIYYKQDNGAVMIADDDRTILSYNITDFYFTPDGRPPRGADILSIRFVDVDPFFHTIDRQISYDEKMTVEDLRVYARSKLGFAHIDLFTFNNAAPELYVFPPKAEKVGGLTLLSPLSGFKGHPNLFAQCSIPIEADTAPISFVVATSLDIKNLGVTNFAFRLPFKSADTFDIVKAAVAKVFGKPKVEMMYVRDRATKSVDVATRAKDLTKGVFFVKVN